MKLDLRKKQEAVESIKNFNSNEIYNFIDFLKKNKSNIEVLNFIKYLLDVEYEKMENFHPNLMLIIEDKQLFNRIYSDNKYRLEENLFYDTTLKNKEIEKLKMKNFIDYKYFKRMAAFLLIFILFSISWSGVSINPQTLFEKYYLPYPSILSNRGENKTQEQQLINKASYYYENNEWIKSESYFNRLIETNPYNSIYNFYLGIIYLELDQVDKSINNFLIVLQSNNYLIEEQANWYLALSYIKKGKQTNAKYYLKKIVNQNSEISKKADRLLNIL